MYIYTHIYIYTYIQIYIYTYIQIYIYIHMIDVIQGKNNQHFNKNILTTHFINSCKLQAYVLKYILTVFTFAFNHLFHLNLISLQTITAPYSASTSDIQLPGHRLKTFENIMGLFLEQFFRKSNYINVTIFLHGITHTCVFQNHTDCK